MTIGKEVGTNEIGIGFANGASQPTPSQPINNVLPMTTARSGNYYEAAALKRLPQTGDKTSLNMQFLGAVCLMLVFWVFLFLQLQKEEETYE